jgi:hypothetical protein
MTVSPVYSEGPNGEQVVDMEVSQGTNVIGRDGMVKGWEADYGTDSQGNTVYDPRLNNDELGNNPVVGFDEVGYEEALLSSNPVIPDALAWAADNMNPDFTADYNKAVDAGDLDNIHPMLDHIINQYLASNPDAEPEQVVEEVEESVSDEEFSSAIDALNEQEVGGTEIAYQWLEAAEQSQDAVYSDVCQMTAAFHRGEISSQEAIDAVIEKHGIKEATRIYKHLTANS